MNAGLPFTCTLTPSSVTGNPADASATVHMRVVLDKLVPLIVIQLAGAVPGTEVVAALTTPLVEVIVGFGVIVAGVNWMEVV